MQKQPSPKQAAMLSGLQKAGLKLTAQRIAVVREIADASTHPTAQELFERLQPLMPTMSFATVYNTLDALVSIGLCTPRALSPGATRFDPNTSPHHHAVCDSCGLVIDIPIDRSGPRSERPGRGGQRAPADGGGLWADLRSSGFTVRAVEQVVRGRCGACAAAVP